ncbi:MAG: hypothetical protein DU429_08510 [Candidatus Tokpelaia sp.]|nr:MAG: hypothetical protein DU430_08580 [Candidatus Tokpelaia sp.]KAA6205086.1 MAG: hypothetical protein DU429_08510 [Candidatus Tokpelaia sp.]
MFPNFYIKQIKEQIRRVGLAETCRRLAGKRDRAAANAAKAGDYERRVYYSGWAVRHEAMLEELEKGKFTLEMGR